MGGCIKGGRPQGRPYAVRPVAVSIGLAVVAGVGARAVAFQVGGRPSSGGFGTAA